MSVSFDRDQAAWGSRLTYPDGTTSFNLDKIVIHWGGLTNGGAGSEAVESRILRGWQGYHIDSKGWSDIAYGYAVGQTGLRYRLRGWNRQGATSGDIDDDGIPENAEAVSFVWIGGTKTAGGPSPAALRSLGRLILDVFAEYGEVPVTVHSDHKATSCPGDDIRSWVNARGWEQATPTPIPEEGEEDTMDIETYVSYLRPSDIKQAADVGIIKQSEVAYFTGLLSSPSDPDWVNFRNAVAVRAPIWT